MARELFGEGKILIGVVHLLPLPGSARWNGNLKSVMNRARLEAGILQDGGAHGVIVENFGDAPFSTGQVGPDTVSGITLAVNAVKDAVGLPIGINMLRSDAYSAMAVAAATETDFIRVNVHYGVMVAEEGIIQGKAHETLRYRRSLGAQERVKIFADVLVKHAVPLGSVDMAQVARETVARGLADVLVVSGPATGAAAALDDVEVVKKAVPHVPVLIGSGIDEGNVLDFLALADGAIVGTSLKVDGIVGNPVDPLRVQRLAHRFSEMGRGGG
jgi:membrane complex biogenesis BtpA family protein